MAKLPGLRCLTFECSQRCTRRSRWELPEARPTTGIQAKVAAIRPSQPKSASTLCPGSTGMGVMQAPVVRKWMREEVMKVVQ